MQVTGKWAGGKGLALGGAVVEDGGVVNAKRCGRGSLKREVDMPSQTSVILPLAHSKLALH